MSLDRTKRGLKWFVVLEAIGLLAIGAYWFAVVHRTDELVHQPQRRQPGGALVICGGGEVPEEVYDRFAQWIGREQGRLVVIPSYEPSPKDLERLHEFWTRRGVASVVVLHASEREQCDDPRFVEPLVEATGVWLTGGAQRRFAELYVNTFVEEQLKALLERGGVIGGISAGAAMMSRVMIVSGSDMADERQGFDLLPGVVIDQHFLERNRFERLLGILKSHPDMIGLGIDEGTAVLIERAGRSWSVIGRSYAVACLPDPRKFPRIEILKPGDETDLARLRSMPGVNAITSRTMLDRLLDGETGR
jgi:cyanophycinase